MLDLEKDNGFNGDLRESYVFTSTGAQVSDVSEDEFDTFSHAKKVMEAYKLIPAGAPGFGELKTFSKMPDTMLQKLCDTPNFKKVIRNYSVTDEGHLVVSVD